METLALEATAEDGSPLVATFLPEKGMNLCSFKKGSLEAIDQETRTLFDERFSGLGPLIGPHFHQRQAAVIPTIPDEALFPHIARIRAQGRIDPFSHGIARYAPWTQVKATANSFEASLTGKEQWHGLTLSQLEGQNFSMRFSGHLDAKGLHLTLSVVSDSDSLAGFHYFYRLPNKRGKLIADVAKAPEAWPRNQAGRLELDLVPELQLDHTLHHYPDPLHGTILLETEEYTLRIQTASASAENSWQLYHPQGATFVCIEPLSAFDPKHPNLTVSTIQKQINFL